MAGKKRSCCPQVSSLTDLAKRSRLDSHAKPHSQPTLAGPPPSHPSHPQLRGLDSLPADILPLIMTSVARTASSPSSFLSAASTCSSLRSAAEHPSALAALDASALLCSVESFSPSYHAFLRRCAAAGNADAQYILGMIEFYCLGNRKDGVKALVRAAKAGHAEALYSLSVIHFNGSGSVVPERKLSVGVLLCASAAHQGHVQALRELGHCFQDGYGIKRDPAEGRRLLMEANLREFIAQHRQTLLAGRSSGGDADAQAMCSPVALEQIQKLEGILDAAKSAAPQAVAGGAQAGAQPSASEASKDSGSRRQQEDGVPGEDGVPMREAQGQEAASRGGVDESSMAFLQSMCQCLQPLLSDSGASGQGPVEPVQGFLLQWHKLRETQWASQGLKVCANASCGRVETRVREFRCCALCSKPSYCSRACQASDWRSCHMAVCQGPEHN